ncbi:MAG TPA: PAS domain S-box protein, partial [Candidatus Limnocylindrales bacterium]|nr:PAS domain S-box protein [Candidatus Limnocylindrales bacterium]
AAERERWFQMSVVRLVGCKRSVVVSHVDITERKLAELEVRESERRFRLMADSAPIMIWMSGTDRLRSNFNKCWLDFTGSTPEKEAGDGWLRALHTDDLPNYLAAYHGAVNARRPFCVEYRLRRFDGEYRVLADRAVPRFRDDGSFTGYIGCCIDLTEQKETERMRAEIGGRLIQAQEEERRRIARELHDDINQKLGLLAIDLQQLQQRATELTADSQQTLTALFERTNKISSDIQHLSHQLHSSRLDYLGLSAALRRLCEEFRAQHSIQMKTNIADMPRSVSRDANLCLFRIAQECLNNTAKHSGATQVTVELSNAEGRMTLSVSDDGKGFEAGRKEDGREPGLGLISMRERLRLVKGELSIESQPGKGTHITAAVPSQEPVKAVIYEEEEAARAAV